MLIQIPLQQRAPLPQAALAEAATEAVLGAGVQPPPPLQQAAAGLPHLPGPLPRQLGPATWSVVHNMFLRLSTNCRVSFQVPLTALTLLYHYCWFSLYEGVLGVRLPLPELLLPLIRSLAPASCNNTVDTGHCSTGTAALALQHCRWVPGWVCRLCRARTSSMNMAAAVWRISCNWWYRSSDS